MQAKKAKEQTNGHQELTVQDIKRALPAHLFVRSESRFLLSVAYSFALTYALYYLAKLYLPLSLTALPLWIAYAFINGTVATGIWVLGHECGHQAFSDKKILNDSLGFLLHTALLVPYFSWQWSHHVHHSKW